MFPCLVRRYQGGCQPPNSRQLLIDPPHKPRILARGHQLNKVSAALQGHSLLGLPVQLVIPQLVEGREDGDEQSQAPDFEWPSMNVLPACLNILILTAGLLILIDKFGLTVENNQRPFDVISQHSCLSLK